MKKTLIMAVCLGLMSFGCQSQEQTHGRTQKMQPSQMMEDQNYHQRRKPRSQGGCCGAEELQAPADLQNETAEVELNVESSE